MSDPVEMVIVLAAVIERDGRFLLARRLKGTHLAGLWEFPGGKCEDGEPHETCLARELREELGVEASIGAELIAIDHVYPERTVRLHFRRCEIAGDPKPMLGQEIQWIARAELSDVDLPEADRALVKILCRT